MTVSDAMLQFLHDAFWDQTLCGGARDEKMATVFDMFRGKEGGSVLVNDVRTYLTSAFRVLFKLKPGLEEHVSVLQPNTTLSVSMAG